MSNNSEINKKYYEENKQKRNVKYICCCGSVSTERNRNRHEQSQKHIKYISENNVIVSKPIKKNFDKSEYNKEYYQLTKDKKNTKYTCECGSVVVRYHLI